MKPFLVGFAACLTIGLVALYFLDKHVIRPYLTNSR